MRVRLLVLAVVSGLGVASCGEKAPPTATQSAGSLATPPAGPQQRPQLPPPPGGAPVAPVAQQPQHMSIAGSVNVGAATAGPNARPGAPTAAPPSDDPIPPADARYTIFCYSANDPAHVITANDVKAELIRKTGRRDFYVIHGREASNLYLGFYRSVNDALNPGDAGEVRRALADKQMLKDLEMLMQTGGGRELGKPFRNVTFVELNAPDPTSPPEWNLANVDRDKDKRDPTRAYWSLQVMAFRGDAKRREAAVQATEALRKNGVDAYYYHGDTVSSVCVGAYPVSAVKQQNAGGREKAEDLSRPDQTLLVSTEPIPDTLWPNPDDKGKKVVAASPRLEVMDPKLEAAIKQFPDHVVNYEKWVRRTSNGSTVADPTFLVVIPRPKGNGLFDEDEVPVPPALAGAGAGAQRPAAATGGTGLRQVQPEGPQAPQPAVQPRPGAGRLRRLGEN